MGAVLHGVCHAHSHGPSQPDPDNINVRAAAAHVLGDLLQSVGVLLAAVIIKVPRHTEFFLLLNLVMADFSGRPSGRPDLHSSFFCDYHFYDGSSGQRLRLVVDAR